MKKICIAGGRYFNDYLLLREEVSKILLKIEDLDIEIVSGGQKTYDVEKRTYYGADYLGEQLAKELKFPVKKFLPDWNRWGKSAGPRRNRQICEYLAPDGILIAFWDKISKGTKNVIEEAEKQNLKIHIINYEL